MFKAIIAFLRLEFNRFLKRKKFHYGNIRTKEQMKNELVKLKSHSVKRQLKKRKYEKEVDDTLYKMLDVANLAIISATLNWCLGRIDYSPIDILVKSIKQRRKAKERGVKRGELLAKWLQDNSIDTSYLEEIIKKVADSNKKK